MDPNQFKNKVCWQSERVGQVINSEAVAIDRADFLATHMPLDHIVYRKSPYALPDTSESGLLKELCDGADESRHMFVVVQGIPGTGKSHLIRWLKERYDASQRDRGQRDVVVLIERANCSLHSTLQQLLDSDAFLGEALAEQRKRLQGAADKLSLAGLADSILNHLQVATHEVELPAGQQPSLRDRDDLEKLLLDYNIRNELKRPGGPINRIVRFLTTGKQDGLRIDERPGFEAQDLDFSVATLHLVKSEGLDAARALANKLKTNLKLRTDLASYLNHLLNFAIGQTTALTADELKQMFGELRRQLRSQGRGLALFIEDITAFTGIDSGLVDVLATQHTGEGNREFCRLISVIGITDAYFEDHFPDNIKDRVTHRLTLNATYEQGHYVSDLLQSGEARASLAAYYLNAIRLDRTVLGNWVAEGARLERLPNACAECPVRIPCHQAFGSVRIGAEDTSAPIEIGLYPFNAHALSRMYQQLDETVVTRTPRSLLKSIVAYVLQSHRDRLEGGTFPPPAHRLGSDFRAPALSKPVQRQLIAAQAGAEADRVESLVIFWGDGTIDATTLPEGKRLIGGLSSEVFEAFALPEIAGAQPSDGPTIVPPPVPPPPSRRTDLLVDTRKGDVPLPGKETASPVVSESLSRLTQDINDWRSGGLLRQYEKLRKYLEDFIQTAIDWEMYDIARFQWEERARAGKLAIEGQSGKMLTNDFLTFPRSNELAYVLQALAELNDTDRQPDAGALGSHLATLSAWLSKNEARIVAYVRQPNREDQEPRPLVEVLTLDAIFFAWLGGDLRARLDPPDILKRLLSDGASALHSSQEALRDWEKRLERAQQIRTAHWPSIMKRMSARPDTAVVACRTRLMQLLNCPQGISTNVLFLDAATALDVISQFEKSDWALPKLELQEQASAPAWSEAKTAYELFHIYLPAIIQEERKRISKWLQDLADLVGDADTEQTQQAIVAVFASLRENNIAYSVKEEPPSSPTSITNISTTLQAILKEQGRAMAARKLSAADKDLDALQTYIGYLDDVRKQLEQRERANLERLKILEAEGSAAELLNNTEAYYTTLKRRLAGVLEPMNAEGVVP